MSTLNGKTALVTGAGSGFGQGIARAFIDAGAVVGVLDVNETSARETAASLGDRAHPLVASVTRQEELSRVLAEFTDTAGPLDILVNNAGIGLTPTALEELDDESFQKVFDVNMRSIFLTAKLCVPAMKARGSGAILNIASTAGVSPRPNLTWYNASKGWVITATRSMAVELAGHNIRVNALNPVAGDTPMLATFLGDDTPENREKFLSTIPLGRFSTPQDLGAAAVFLCSDAASLITGVALEVDGGRCI